MNDNGSYSNYILYNMLYIIEEFLDFQALSNLL